MKHLHTYQSFLNEGSSFTDSMNPQTKEIYQEYQEKISSFEIFDHKKLDATLKSDDRVKKSGQEKLLQTALGWALTYAQEMER
jgi:hypothetical protein